MSSERYHSFEEPQGIRIHHEIQLRISLHNFTLHFGISTTFIYEFAVSHQRSNILLHMSENTPKEHCLDW